MHPSGPTHSIKQAGVFILVSLFFYACNPQREPASNKLPRSSPEAEGVSSEAILKFLNAAEASTTEFHSIMILRHGRVITEGWWKPYGPELRHTLYSTSKSFTSTAVGLAVMEGRLDVEDKVIPFFPDLLPDTVSPHLSDLEIRHLLTMSAGQDPDPTSFITTSDTNWVRGFLDYPVEDAPGTTFLYNSMATFMLSAIVQKVTGEQVIDYLTPRLFEPLDIRGMDWEVSPGGINTGGWGLRVRTEDMARFGQLYLRQGKWNGTTILSGDWVEEATRSHIIQSPELPPETREESDWLQGYGYQFWRCRHGAFRADGAFGQFIVVMPEQDAVVAITAESPDMQSELDLVWDYLLPAFTPEMLPPDEKASAALNDRLNNLALPFPQGVVEVFHAMDVSGKKYRFDSNSPGIESLEIKFTLEKTCEILLEQKGKSYSLRFGEGDWLFQETEKHGPNLLNRALNHFEGLRTEKVAGSYAWTDEHTLELVLRYIESPHHETYRIVFGPDQISLIILPSLPGQKGTVTLRGMLTEKG